jgi:ribosomal protein S18 acetylase RimI-like enzyme
MADLRVRPYGQADRTDVFRIAADTAFLGNPVEAYLDDRRLFCDLFYAYYCDLEPEHGWVACVDTEVVGFVMAAVDTTVQHRRSRLEIWPRVLCDVAGGHYCLRRKTWQYIGGLVRASLSGESVHADLRVYPAHLHVNVDRVWRGQGIGRRLMDACLDQIRSLQMSGIHLHTTNRNEAACRLYEALGFRLLASHRTTLWSRYLASPVVNRCYGLRLAAQLSGPHGIVSEDSHDGIHRVG